MNWTFEYSKDANFVKVTDEGNFNLKDHARKMDELTSQDFWQPGINILFDCTGVDFSDTDYDVIRKAANGFVTDDRLLGCNKIALLMKTVADYGRGRQFEMLTDEKMCADIRVFMDEKLAVRWLEG